MSWYPNGYVSGAKPTAERIREYAPGHAVGQLTKAVQDLIDARTEKRLRRNRYLDHHQPTYRDGNGVLRAGQGYDPERGWRRIAGRFVKDTTPAHKRPRRIPWSKPGRQARRKAKRAGESPSSNVRP